MQYPEWFDGVDWEKWLAGSLPPPIRAVASAMPAWRCYRAKHNVACHYIIQGYEIDAETGYVRLRLLHGVDSLVPGMVIHSGIPSSLVYCDCGKWEPPPVKTVRVGPGGGLL